MPKTHEILDPHGFACRDVWESANPRFRPAQQRSEQISFVVDVTKLVATFRLYSKLRVTSHRHRGWLCAFAPVAYVEGQQLKFGRLLVVVDHVAISALGCALVVRAMMSVLQ